MNTGTGDLIGQKIGDVYKRQEEYRDDKSKQYFFADYKSDMSMFQENNDTQSSFNGCFSHQFVP